jgi:hypothetical protein
MGQAAALFAEQTGRPLTVVNPNQAYVDSHAGSRIELRRAARTWWVVVDGIKAGHRPWPHTAVALMVQELRAEENLPSARTA